MSDRTRFDAGRLLTVARAEFAKIWASRIPPVILAALPPATYLFVFELYHVERVAERLAIANAAGALPFLFFATWKTLLFQAAMVTFAAFWATVDSQYGMIRVGCCQPLTRVEYLLGKWAAIGAHIAIFSVALTLCLSAWAAAYSGLRGIGAAELAALARFIGALVQLTLAVCLVATAVASARRTVGSGLVTALMAIIALAFMTMLPFEVLAPRFVLMRYFFYPLQELAAPLRAGGDSPFQRPDFLTSFYAVALVTPVVFALPAVLRFRRRDIVE